ncbi:MAG TPA: ribbon-helix-helix domain-containing protein [Sphingobium sp.]
MYAGPVKRSMTIAGHSTSISLEPPFWNALERAARTREIPLNALVARIDADRVDAGGATNLASVLRCWLLDDAQRRHVTPIQR